MAEIKETKVKRAGLKSLIIADGCGELYHLWAQRGGAMVCLEESGWSSSGEKAT